MDAGGSALARAISVHPEQTSLGFADVVGHWTPSVFVWLMLAVSATVYTAGVSRLWSHAGRGRGIRVRETAAYGAGLLSLVIALVSPLDYLSDISFYAHMSQHEILMLVAAPLVALGRPMIAGMWALPVGARHTVAELTQG